MDIFTNKQARLPLPLILSYLLVVLWHSVVYAREPNGNWVSLPVIVARKARHLEILNNYGHDRDLWSYVQVTLGTPPQPVNLVVDFESSLLSAWSSECAFCPYFWPFFPERSSTLRSENKPWELNSATAHGSWCSDVGGFGELQVEDVQFVLMDDISMYHQGLNPLNGILGLWSNSTSDRKTLISHLWDSGALLNPVVGIRLDHDQPRMTIGALDPADYVGTINWIEVQGQTNEFAIDGLKGYDGSFIPFDADEIIATLSTLLRDIVVPPEVYDQYFSNTNYHGPNLVINGTTITDCLLGNTLETLPPASFVATINGVDYPIAEQNFNWIYPSDGDGCNIRMSTYTNLTNSEDTSGVRPVRLGLPFMSSVYIAYRFPTSDSPNCPAYIGFAFPSGTNHTAGEINQKPRLLPPLHDQCLSFILPEREPFSEINGSEPQFERGSGAYRVYGDSSGERQVRLVGVDELVF
ncbi:hypothetical protein AX16_002501 [Volvariella volvacea WC 439]|nr:hypothetical protein AX16_002501 [Volvariella volvacea WC 439]